MTIKTPILSMLVAVLILATAGCESQDEPSAFVQEATLRQAEQSQTVAETGKQVAQTSQQFVEAEAAARREVIALQENLRQDQAELGKQRDALEAERQSLDARRQTQLNQERRDSTLSAILTSGGVIIACLAPLLLAAAALWGLWRDDISDQAASELLITEIDPEPPHLTRQRLQTPDHSAIGHANADRADPPRLPPAD
jgi:hypothetical protein